MAESPGEQRSIQFLSDGPRIPLELIRARDAGDVVFVVGAGASKGSGFPLFWELTRNVYLKLTGTNPVEKGQVRPLIYDAFRSNALDFVLGHLERQIDGDGAAARRTHRVRETVAEELSSAKATDLSRHRDLLILARDQGGEPRLVTHGRCRRPRPPA